MYNQLRETLAARLQVEPDPKITALFRRMKVDRARQNRRHRDYLDHADSALRQVIGGSSGTLVTLTSDSSSDPVGDLHTLNVDLHDFHQAIESKNTGDALRLQGKLLLRLQKSLADQADQADADLKDVQSKPAEEVLSAVAALRAAFAGDTSKLADARAQLRVVSGDSPAPRTSASAPAANSPGFDSQAIAGGVRNKLTSLSDAVHDPHQSPDEIAKRRDAVNAEATKAEAALQGVNDPRADQLRSALTTAREAAAGEDAKVQNALSGLDTALKGH